MLSCVLLSCVLCLEKEFSDSSLFTFHFSATVALVEIREIQERMIQQMYGGSGESPFEHASEKYHHFKEQMNVVGIVAAKKLTKFWKKKAVERRQSREAANSRADSVGSEKEPDSSLASTTTATAATTMPTTMPTTLPTTIPPNPDERAAARAPDGGRAADAHPARDHAQRRRLRRDPHAARAAGVYDGQAASQTADWNSKSEGDPAV